MSRAHSIENYGDEFGDLKSLHWLDRFLLQRLTRQA